MNLEPQTGAVILRRAAELVDHGHIKGVAAADKDGFVVSTVSETACQFCALGAILYAWLDPRFLVCSSIDFPDLKGGNLMTNTQITQLSAATDAAMLRDAAELVKRGWTRAYTARDNSGEPCGYDMPQADMFCAVGAVNRAVMNGLGGHREIIYTNLFSETVDRLSRNVVEPITELSPGQPCKFDDPETHIAEWNDSWVEDPNTVIAVLNKAATLAAATADTTEHGTT